MHNIGLSNQLRDVLILERRLDKHLVVTKYYDTGQECFRRPAWRHMGRRTSTALDGRELSPQYGTSQSYKGNGATCKETPIFVFRCKAI